MGVAGAARALHDQPLQHVRDNVAAEQLVRRLAESGVRGNRVGEIFLGYGEYPILHMLLQRLTCIDLMTGNANIH